MYQESFAETFGQKAPPLGAAFGNAHDPESSVAHGIYSERAETGTDQTHMSDQDGHDFGPDQNSKISRTLTDIESLINSGDYTGAAEEILKINIGSLPISALDRYTDALEQTAHGLYNKDTYLNAQLATQSLTVMAVSDAVEEMKGPLDLCGNDQSATVGSLCMNIQLFDANEGGLPLLVWNDEDVGIGIADEYNVQLSPDTGALARFMANETAGNHRAASLDHGGAAGQHAYSLDLKMGF